MQKTIGLRRFLRVLVLLTVCHATSYVASASDYAFTLHNRSNGWVINGFYTLQGGKWSKNWLSGKVRSGQAVKMDWASNEGNCVVPFRVSWEEYGSEDFKLDWCKGVKNVYMKDKGFNWD